MAQVSNALRAAADTIAHEQTLMSMPADPALARPGVRPVGQRLSASRRLVAVQKRALATQRHANRGLERAILPPHDPAITLDGLRVAVRYHAAERAVAVGGDWFLTEALPGGGVLLAVGDVAGHGLAAAPAMVQLRHAAAGLAAAGHGPGEILAVLNRMMWRHEAAPIATAVIATYRPDTRCLTWARAGHPPIVVASSERAHPLWGPDGTMLGVDPDAAYAHQSRPLAVDDVVLLYTDGYIEEPGVTVDEGVRVLGERARRALQTMPIDRPGAIVTRLRRCNDYDDACLMAAELVS